MSESNAPHIIVLGAWVDADYDGEDFGHWDWCDITCPHQQATASMLCAMWEPCGHNPGIIGEMDFRHEEEIEFQSWPCSSSPTGVHRYIEGEPNRPVAKCFAADWSMEIERRAFEMGLPAGTYLVHPWWDEYTVRLDLIDPLVATQ